MKLATGTILDRYEVLGELGQGGMASVYTVRHTKLGSTHVLKVLTVRGQNVAERLLLEGQVQAKLKHPNVVEVTDVIEVQGAPGLVMEYIEGPSLDAVLANGPLPLDRVADLVPGICAGIAAAHAEGVVHRDLKPANILLSLARGRVVPKIADFGLVKQLATDPREARTRTGTAMGTPQYMAPEQIENAKEVDERADIWALGAILYEMVTGERAFDGDTHYRIFQQVVAREYRPVREVNPAVPPSMIAAIEAAMRTVEERPRSVEAIWALWQPDQPLENAATTSSSWPEGTLSALTALTPSVVASEVSMTPTSPSVSQDTFVDLDGPDSLPEIAQLAPVSAPPSVPPLAEAPPQRMNLMVGVVGLLVVVVAALVALVCMGPMGLGITRQSASTPPVLVAPAPPAPVPPAPALTPSTPVAPTPPVAPVPVAPVPVPVAPVPVAPAPVAPPPPTPVAASGVLVVQGAGALDVYLVGDNGRFSGGDIPPGTYEIKASEGARTESFGKATVTAGQTLVVKCMGEMWHCKAQN